MTLPAMHLLGKTYNRIANIKPYTQSNTLTDINCSVYTRDVKLIFTEGHISIMFALKGPVVTVWFPSKGQLQQN